MTIIAAVLLNRIKIYLAPFFNLKKRWIQVMRIVNKKGIAAGKVTKLSTKSPFVNNQKERWKPQVRQSIPKCFFQLHSIIYKEILSPLKQRISKIRSQSKDTRQIKKFQL